MHSKSAWFLRDFGSTTVQTLQVSDVYAGFTLSTRPCAFCSNRITNWLQPAARMPRFRPAFARTLRPGFSRVPRAERVMPGTFRSSTRFLEDARMRALARDNAISESTAYDYRDEGIAVLAIRRPGLHGALLAAKAAGHTHVILD